MFKFDKTLRNNLVMNSYIFNIDDLATYDFDKRNPRANKVDFDSKLYKKVKEYEEEYRKNNYKVFVNNLLKIKFKKFIIIGAPIFAATSIAASCQRIINHPTIESFDIYQKNVIIYSETHILANDQREKVLLNDNKFQVYQKSKLDYGLVISADDQYEVVFGEGSNALKGTFTISNNIWTLKNISDVSHYVIDDIKDEEQESIPDSFKEALKIAGDMIKESENITEEQKKIIDDAINNDAKDIYATWTRYEKIGTTQAGINDLNYVVFGGVAILNLILALFYIIYIDKLTHYKEIYNEDGCLKEKLMSNSPNIFLASREYKREFILSETMRIHKIYELLETNNTNKDILSNYEKKLLKIDKK